MRTWHSAIPVPHCPRRLCSCHGRGHRYPVSMVTVSPSGSDGERGRLPRWGLPAGTVGGWRGGGCQPPATANLEHRTTQSLSPPSYTVTTVIYCHHRHILSPPSYTVPTVSHILSLSHIFYNPSHTWYSVTSLSLSQWDPVTYIVLSQCHLTSCANITVIPLVGKWPTLTYLWLICDRRMNQAGYRNTFPLYPTHKVTYKWCIGHV